MFRSPTPSEVPTNQRLRSNPRLTPRHRPYSNVVVAYPSAPRPALSPPPSGDRTALPPPRSAGRPTRPPPRWGGEAVEVRCCFRCPVLPVAEVSAAQPRDFLPVGLPRDHTAHPPLSARIAEPAASSPATPTTRRARWAVRSWKGWPVAVGHPYGALLEGPVSRVTPAGTPPRPDFRGSSSLPSWVAVVVDTLVTGLGALVAMTAVAALGLWLAHADRLPGSGFGSALAATVLMSMGVPVHLEGSALLGATAHGGLTAVPLSVTLAGALAAAFLFLRPLRRHPPAGGTALLSRTLALAGCWTTVALLLAWTARHSFTVSTGDPLIDQIGGALGLAPVVGFRVDPAPAVGCALLWLTAVVALALAASHRTPLPARWVPWHRSLRPTVRAVLSLLLLYVGLGLVGGLAAAAAGNEPRETLAVVVLGLPNLAWLALGIGMGGSWHGHVAGNLGLPLPQPLAAVLHSDRDVSLELGSLAQQSGWVWLLLPVAALLVLATGVAASARSRPQLPAWRTALQLAVLLALAMLAVGLLTRVSAVYGLSVLGLSGTGSTELVPDLLTLVPSAAGWGALAGFVGGVLAPRLTRHRSAAARRDSAHRAGPDGEEPRR
ncbi:streptophobe family protein [Kitasatospora sp. NPDC059646]|uniref:streptophobe family protein n=1 Tax=Kitasatospora sp. NPDC059646 TaxID=3346893 RepID=UPI0036AAF349